MSRVLPGAWGLGPRPLGNHCSLGGPEGWGAYSPALTFLTLAVGPRVPGLPSPVERTACVGHMSVYEAEGRPGVGPGCRRQWVLDDSLTQAQSVQSVTQHQPGAQEGGEQRGLSPTTWELPDTQSTRKPYRSEVIMSTT